MSYKVRSTSKVVKPYCVALCKSGTGCGGNRPSAPLWFHSTRFGSFSTLGEMDINSKMSGDPRQGRDLGGLVVTLSEDRDARAQAHSFGHDEQEHER